MKAKKLKSGSWRVQVFSYTDENGKKHRESFTAPTKAEAEMKAAEYAARKKRAIRHDLTVGEAIDGFLKAKEPVLSPSTIRSYYAMRNIFYDGIKRKRIKTLTSEDMQLFVSDLSQKVSYKTVKNAYSLLTASIKLYAPDLAFRVTMPAKKVYRPESPSDDDIRAVYNAAKENMRPLIVLAMCGLRAGEICALKYEDIENGVAHIHADLVKSRTGEWIYKEVPKTDGSDRYIKLPNSLLNQIGSGEGFISRLKPNSLSKNFANIQKSLGLHFRLHDMRHYFASTATVLNIPDTYIADFGGWQRGGSVMKSVYQNNITSMSEYYADKLNQHFDDVLGKQ